MPVEGCKMDNCVTLLYKGLQFSLDREKVILKRDAGNFILLKSKEIIEVGSYKSGLAGDADLYHLTFIELFFDRLCGDLRQIRDWGLVIGDWKLVILSFIKDSWIKT